MLNYKQFKKTDLKFIQNWLDIDFYDYDGDIELLTNAYTDLRYTFTKLFRAIQEVQPRNHDEKRHKMNLLIFIKQRLDALLREQNKLSQILQYIYGQDFSPNLGTIILTDIEAFSIYKNKVHELLQANNLLKELRDLYALENSLLTTCKYITQDKRKEAT